MSERDEEELLNQTLEAYVESTGHLPGADEIEHIIELVEEYLEDEE